VLVELELVVLQLGWVEALPQLEVAVLVVLVRAA
jgi:hypothetical protein